MTFTTTLDEREVEVDYDCIPASRGHRDRFGAPEEPDEPATVEVAEVRDASTGELIEPSPAEAARLEELAWNEIECSC